MTFFLPGDVAVATYISSIRTVELSWLLIDYSELASPQTALGLGLIIGLGLYLRRKFAAIAGLAVAIGGANAAWIVIKEQVNRPRPPMRVSSFLEPGSSFPSGHTTDAFALAVFGSILIYEHVPAGWARNTLIGVCMSLATLMGFARVYLGVHYLSDCIAGALLGTFFGFAGALVTRSVRDYSTRMKNSAATAMR